MAVIGVAVVVLAGFIKRITTHYTITTRRLHIKRGIIAREIQETRLERVQNVNYNQSLIQRMLQVGDVDFDTAAGDDYNFIFAGVANPDEVVEQVDRATHAAPASGLGDEPTAPTRLQELAARRRRRWRRPRPRRPRGRPRRGAPRPGRCAPR